MAFPSGFNVTELSNIAVADPVGEGSTDSWTAGYKTGQDFHIDVDVPDTSPGIVYGLNQTLLMAIRTAIYDGDQAEDIQIWRTPRSTNFDFKGNWLDSVSTDSTDPTFPYYSDEAVAKTELREQKIDGKDAYHVSLRMRKTPQVTLPAQIQRKNNKDEKMTINQLDVQELYLISLLRDEDVKNGKTIPLAQWTWKHKHAWTAVDRKPEFVSHPSDAGPCILQRRRMDKCQLAGPTEAAGEHWDHFRVLNNDGESLSIGEVSEWMNELTDEWEACDV